MTQVFDETGKVIPVTLIEAGPCVVAQVKTMERDGYQAVQLGFGAVKKIDKARQGHFKNLGQFKYLREFKNGGDLKIGDQIKVDIFQEGEAIKVTGVSKGKGFAGVVKRHGFGGGPASHGQKDRLRAPGSIGMSFPERVTKGRRMAGRMGQDRVTVAGLKIIHIDQDRHLLAVTGAVPGNRGCLVEIVS